MARIATDCSRFYMKFYKNVYQEKWNKTLPKIVQSIVPKNEILLSAECRHVEVKFVVFFNHFDFFSIFNNKKITFLSYKLFSLFVRRRTFSEEWFPRVDWPQNWQMRQQFFSRLKMPLSFFSLVFGFLTKKNSICKFHKNTRSYRLEDKLVD
jgi:hypothetical protein